LKQECDDDDININRKNLIRQPQFASRNINYMGDRSSITNVNYMGDRSFDPRQGQRIFPLTSVSRPALGPTQPPWRVAGLLCLM
jgi:hypothetical protein